MLERVRKILLLASFVFGNLTILVVSFLILTVLTTRSSTAVDIAVPQTVNIVQSSNVDYGVVPQPALAPKGEIIAGDGRAIILEQFFRRYNSPMGSLGDKMVQAADKYKLPFNLMPAIAQCEGNLGKVMPFNSYNPFGFGIYGTTVTRFSSWDESFEKVAKTLRKDYFDLGLITPDLMMPKYTPPSKGSWADCVKQFMKELE